MNLLRLDGHFADAAELWFEGSFIATTALEFGIAGCICVWSFHRERNAAGVLRANQDTPKFKSRRSFRNAAVTSA
jgi:hypothetical protein